MNVEFLDDGAYPKPKTVVARLCSDPYGPDQAPVINARSFHNGPKTGDEAESNGPAQSWQVCAQAPIQTEKKLPSWPIDDGV